MVVVSVVLLGIIFGLLGGALYYFISFWITHRSKQKELDILLEAVIEDAKTVEEALKIAQEIQPDGVSPTKSTLTNNEYLTTLITVMVKKYGDEIRLTGYDFKSVGMDEYVTLYVDMNNHDIILRSNSGSSLSAELASYIMPPDTDEDTFH